MIFDDFFKGKRVWVEDSTYDIYSKQWFGRVNGKAVTSEKGHIWKRVNQKTIDHFNRVKHGIYRLRPAENGNWQWLRRMAEHGAQWVIMPNGTKHHIEHVIRAWQKNPPKPLLALYAT